MKLQELKQSDFKIKLIRDLGMKSFPDRRRRVALFGCDTCNKEIEMQTQVAKRLSNGTCRSCKLSIRNTRHNLSKHPLYIVWKGMKARCGYTSSSVANCYADVTICDEWLNDFSIFYNWSMSNGYKKGLEIDKDILCHKNNIKPKKYSPSTCLWVTRERNMEEIRKGYDDNT